MVPEEIEYYRIKNWEKFQHRDHKKSMPWIRLWNHILEDDSFTLLSAFDQLIYIKLLVLAARTGNLVVATHSFISTRIGHRNVSRSLQNLEQFQLIERFSARRERAESAPPPRHIRQDKIRPQRVESITPSIFDPQEIRELWEKYPKKAAGVLSLTEFEIEIHRHIPNRETFEALKSAITKYAHQTYDTDKQYLRNFRRFLAGGYWRTYLEETKPSEANPYVIRQSKGDEPPRA